MTSLAARSCSQTTMRVYDAGAVILALVGVLLALKGSPGIGGDHWTDFMIAGLGGVTMIGALIAASLRRKPEGDEYSRLLLGKATMTGFYIAFAAYVVWAPLAPATLPEPGAHHIIALLLGGTGLGWFIARGRDA